MIEIPDLSPHRYIMSLDPGGTTGWALSKLSATRPLEFIDGGQISGGVDGFVDWYRVNSGLTWAATNNLNPILSHPELYGLVIVSESFTLRPGVKSPDVTPLRIEGALSVLAPQDRLVYQQPAHKSLVGDQKLKELDFWIPGQRHQMDARIHALAYAVRQRHIPTLEAYWPERGY